MTNKILIIDDTEENIDILVDLLCDKYEILVALDGRRGIDLAKEHQPDLILLDIMMPGLNGYEVCELLKHNKGTLHIPIIFLTALSNIEDEKRGIDCGAIDFIHKPFHPPLILSRIKNNIFFKQYQNDLEHLVKIRSEKIEKTKEVIIKGMGIIAEYRDPETGDHIKRTQYYVKAIASYLMKNQPELNLTSDIIESLYKSAPLHDIGKVSTPDEILMKPGPLTKEEFEIMKEHTIVGEEALRKIHDELPNEMFLTHALEIAISHHERWDGSGYPYGLSGDAIPLSGRIMAVADVYDALISKRVYKDAFSHEKAKAIIVSSKGEHFDPIMVDAFLELEDEFVEIAAEYRD